jgi:hypothetical protein
MKAKEKPSNLFVEMCEDNRTFYILNREFNPKFKNNQEASEFLLEALHYWKGKRSFFCHFITTDSVYNEETDKWDNIDLPEDEWTTTYKTPSTCGSCREAQDLLDILFGSCREFNRLPYVKFLRDREYEVSFRLLKHFVENGEDATTLLVQEEKRQTEAKRLAEQRKRAERSVIEALGGVEVSDVNLNALVKFCENDRWEKFVKVVSQDLIICDGHRSLNSGSAGMGYFSQIHVWYKGQTGMKEWQWRDCYSADRDRHDLRINDTGDIKVKSVDGKVEIGIQLLNMENGSWYTTFCFEDNDIGVFPELSEEDQKKFARTFDAEIQRIFTDLEERWTWKNPMLTSNGQENYEHPSIKQRVLDIEHGVGAFVTKEQIDHRTGGNRQTRFELLIMKVGDEKSKRMWEDHGYEKTEGARAISITSLNPDQIQVATHDGPKTIKIG